MINPTYFVCANSSSSLILASILLCGCSILTPSNISPPRLYSFDSSTTTTTLPHLATANAINRQVTIVVGIPRAAPGFESRQMAYIRQTHQLEYFKQSEWVAAPATMLSPLVASALESSAQFKAVIQAPTSILAQFRLDVEIVRLQQEFFRLPSQVHFTLRAHVLDALTRQVIASHEFDSFVAASSEDPYGGVIATNTVMRNVTKDLADFCVQAISSQKSDQKNDQKK